MKLRSNRHSSLLAVCAVSILMSGSMASTMASMRASANTDPKAPAPAPQILGEVPRDIPFPDADGKIYFTGEGGSRRATTINPYLQMRLQAYIKDRGNPIAAVVVADVRTGKVLAMAQGKRLKAGEPSATQPCTQSFRLHPSSRQ